MSCVGVDICPFTHFFVFLKKMKTREILFWVCVAVLGLLLYSVLFFKRIRIPAAVLLLVLVVWAVGVRYANTYSVEWGNSQVLQLVPEQWKLKMSVVSSSDDKDVLRKAVLNANPDSPTHECIVKHGLCSKKGQKVNVENVAKVVQSFPKGTNIIIQEPHNGKEFQIAVQTEHGKLAFEVGQCDDRGKCLPVAVESAALKDAVGAIVASIPGTQYTELLVRAASVSELKKGTFKVLKTRGALHSSYLWAKKKAGKKTIFTPCYTIAYQVRAAYQGWANIVSGRTNPSFKDIAAQVRMLKTCKDPYFFFTTRA